MKMCKRLLGVGLSALLVMGCTLPALAAEDSTEKDETVYVVLEPDGSVRSQTVSAHLHNGAGLAGVTDRTSLTGIENTHDTAGFTQSGEELAWDTDGADVYYKGETDREAPIRAQITYELDGRAMAPEDLAGQSGHVKLSVKLTNNETGTVQIDGKSQKVCTPFVTMVAAVLGEGWEDVSAAHGTLKGVGKSQAVGFVCLPGVRECLEQVGSDKLEGLEDNLLDEIAVEGDVTDFTVPDILIACATEMEALRENGFSGLDKLDGLEDDMGDLRDGMDELLDGADRLAEGAAALESGAAALMAGVDTLYAGAQSLQDGTAQLQQGAHELSAGAAEARDGAAALQAGANDLAAGLSNLQNGAGALSNGYSQLKSGSANLAAGLNTLQGSSQALIDGVGQLTGGIAEIYAAAGPGSAVMGGAQSFGDSLSGAASNAAAAAGALPDPSGFQGAACADDPAYQQLLNAYTQAYGAANSMAGGMGELNSAYGQVLGGLQQVGAGVEALQAGANGAEGLSAGLGAYTQGVADAAAGAAQLDSGIAQLGANLPALTGGVDQLIAGSNQLSAGAGTLSQGNAALAEGASRLAQGTDELASGVSELLSGVAALVDGAASLHSGTVELGDGAGALQEGLGRFDSEGISQLTGAVDTDKLPTLKSLTAAMRQRLEDYGSFAGAPEGAEVTTVFVMKTAAQPQEEEPEEDAPQEDSGEHGDFWQRVAGLFDR